MLSTERQAALVPTVGGVGVFCLLGGPGVTLLLLALLYVCLLLGSWF
jgi:hypothetical protein